MNFMMQTGQVFLEVDPDSKVWWPFDWLSVKSGDMTKMYLDEFEPLSIVPRWVAAMELNQAIVLRDREEIKDDYPEENMHCMNG